MLNFNKLWLKARTYYHLKSLILKGDKISPRAWEVDISHAIGMEHKGDNNNHADAVGGDIQVSIKTVFLKPKILKKSARDFQSKPEKFIGPTYTKKHDYWINGIELVQRRQAITDGNGNTVNESTLSAKEIGELSIQGFKKTHELSYAYYGTKKTYEVIVINGYDCTGYNYLTSIFWDEYKFPDISTMEWKKTTGGVDGYQQINGKYTKTMTRIDGNVPRHATCFKEYKNLLSYENNIHYSVPIPELNEFNEEQIINEINTIENSRENK